ncbi:MAG TPA: Crp/Fnr family transcriptional regulator [Solirubrobacterales bacterium]|nr:Crp/Fnr family transcriptional regulator [Solirubrobacterales bacterium]
MPIEPEPGSFLALLAEADREALLALGRSQSFRPGEHLMRQEEPGDPVLLLRQGHVKATFVEPQGREIVLSFHGPGDVLGELSFVRAEPRSSNVVAIEAVEAEALAAAEFRAFLGQRPSTALALFDAIGRRFRDANRTQVQFGASDTIGRIAARLVELCERHGHPTAAGIEIRLPVTQQDLGGWTGASRAGVASALRTMRGLGWVKTERKRITVLDLDGLAARAES